MCGGKVYPLIQQAGIAIRSSTPSSQILEIDPNSGLCFPFLGLTTSCQGTFNFGTSKPTESTTLMPTVTSSSTSSQITATSPITQTMLPVATSSARTEEASQKSTTENTVTTSGRPSEVGTPFDHVTSADPVAEHLVRTTRSSVSTEGSSLPFQTTTEFRPLTLPFDFQLCQYFRYS